MIEFPGHLRVQAVGPESEHMLKLMMTPKKGIPWKSKQNECEKPLLSPHQNWGPNCGSHRECRQGVTLHLPPWPSAATLCKLRVMTFLWEEEPLGKKSGTPIPEGWLGTVGHSWMHEASQVCVLPWMRVHVVKEVGTF